MPAVPGVQRPLAVGTISTKIDQIKYLDDTPRPCLTNSVPMFVDRPHVLSAPLIFGYEPKSDCTCVKYHILGSEYESHASRRGCHIDYETNSQSFFDYVVSTMAVDSTFTLWNTLLSEEPDCMLSPLISDSNSREDGLYIINSKHVAEEFYTYVGMFSTMISV